MPENPGVPPEFVLQARDRFCGWLAWFMATRPEVAPTKAALARKLGIGKPALNRLLAHGSRIVPDLRTVLSAEQLTGIPVSALLHSDPPPLPPT